MGNSKVFIKRQNFGQVQIKSFCRPQFKCASNIEICFWYGIFSFSTMFSKGHFSRSLKVVIVWKRVKGPPPPLLQIIPEIKRQVKPLTTLPCMMSQIDFPCRTVSPSPVNRLLYLYTHHSYTSMSSPHAGLSSLHLPS